ncbi:hypothetical protein [Ornithinimicrobium cerasi]|uniref:hypothetical protein n=1 Tax=Ornithinimicrobium cerasi TaxID=2248773 RepID=UPI000F00B998|nr:hypothetical protein [Ornithinimicrobium cerasi]
MTFPEAVPSGISFPGRPTYAELLESDERIAWVRFKVWSADWYTGTLGGLGAEDGYDRYIGIEMALDGALSALSAAFDAAVVLMIESAEEALQVPEEKRLAPHKYNWEAFKRTVQGTLLTASNALSELSVDVDDALEGANSDNPVGWLAVLRRLRNRATHRTTLARTWAIDHDAHIVLGVTEVPELDPFEYLKLSCDQVSDLTERMHGIANQFGYVGASTPLARTRWG